jgi:hypothetical protein
MLKLLSLSLILISVSTEAATGYPASRSSQSGIFLDEENASQTSPAQNASYLTQPSDSNYPIVPSADVDQLTCYMETADSRLLNLNRMCQQPEPSGTQTLGRTNTSSSQHSTTEGNTAESADSAMPDVGGLAP